MNVEKPAPVLPPGNASVFTGIGENFQFHSSPEAFLASRLLEYQKANPGVIDSRTAVRAKILNRNVIVVSAYKQIEQVLVAGDGDDTPYVAVAPYRQLMESFFPPPNLLLADGCPHHRIRKGWDRSAENLLNEDVVSRVSDIANQHVSDMATKASIDLYACLKDLAWRLFLKVFLDMDPQDSNYAQYVKLQEHLLRGQFSLMPISINAGFWQSPRSIGIDSRKKLQTIIAGMLKRQRPAWLASADQPEEELINHILMATSSLAVKAFASLCLALLLNTLVLPGKHVAPDGEDRVQVDGTHGDPVVLGAVLNETLRLSPPIVGVMRRATRQQTMSSADQNQRDILIPAGWDVWTYFAGGNRDKSVYGSDADLFKPDRYISSHEQPPQPIAFGIGSKACLGSAFARTAAGEVLKAFKQFRLELDSPELPAGVQGWLGWKIASPEQWAQDIKQLPTQRPSRPIMVRVEG